MVALVHDMIITAGVYSLSGFEVTPSTVIALLTILGYSLYDTVVIFDRVKDRTAIAVRRGTRDVLGGRERGAEPGAAAVAEHVDRLAAPGREPALRRFVPPRRLDAARARARAVHRHRGRRVLVGLHRDAAPCDLEGARSRAGRRCARASPRGPGATRSPHRGWLRRHRARRRHRLPRRSRRRRQPPPTRRRRRTVRRVSRRAAARRRSGAADTSARSGAAERCPSTSALGSRR